MNPYTLPITKAQILSRTEMAQVLRYLHRIPIRRGYGGNRQRMNLAIFRLAACCGLRVSEIAQLKQFDLQTETGEPHVRVRKATTKGKANTRYIPLSIDKGTLSDLRAWKAERTKQGAGPDDYVFVSERGLAPMDRTCLRDRFITACWVLGADRRRRLTIHHGRHTAISFWLDAGVSLAQAAQWAGHASIATTNRYVHVMEKNGVTDVFAPHE